MAKPRVYVSLDHETYKVILRMCQLLGISKSEMISQCMDEMCENLAEFIDVVDKLSDTSSFRRHPSNVARLLVGADNRFAGLADEVSGNLRTLLQDLEALEEANGEGIIGLSLKREEEGSRRRDSAAGGQSSDEESPLSINKGAKVSSPSD